MSNEEQIQHTAAVQLCSRLTELQSRIGSLQHELVLHYSAKKVPSRKTRGSVTSLKHGMERTKEELETIEAELEKLDR